MHGLPTETVPAGPVSGDYVALSFRFCVSADVELGARFARAYAPLAVSYEGEPAEHGLSIREVGTNIIVQLDDEPALRVADREQALTAAMSLIDAASVRATSDLLLIHASAVRSPKGLVLFAGASGAGKSTLAAACTARGFTYIGDEVLGIDRGGRRMRSNPKPFKLDEASVQALMLFAGIQLPHATPHSPEVVVAPQELGSSVQKAWVRAPSVVMQVAFAPGAGAEIARVSRADVAELLADQCFNFARWGARGLDLVAALARQTTG
jgi:hypothetical protein